ncbi:hypothetical protein JZ751_011997 [Albula glossodonta]|uniref:Uncharacterized protein n=1 Tax=Albula glossodonta TaxID=121402 RepID=A0A8T2PR84_9TELE|nr:hypothetical protein JZ751_011997 [Albula glossodonta]
MKRVKDWKSEGRNEIGRRKHRGPCREQIYSSSRDCRPGETGGLDLRQQTQHKTSFTPVTARGSIRAVNALSTARHWQKQNATPNSIEKAK